MQHRVDEIARIVRPCAHAVLLPGRAARHTADALKWPHNISSLLPTYAPELNPVENAWPGAPAPPPACMYRESSV